MAKDINLNSPEWCDIVFEGRNKTYGAYFLRQNSGKRIRIAFLVIVLFAAFIAYLPTLVETVKSRTQQHDKMVDVTTISNLKKLKDEVKEENIIRKEDAPPPPPLKTTIKYTPPVITDAADVRDDQQMKSMEELSTSKVQISVADVKGSNAANAVDIADLQQHKVVVEDKEEEKPLYGVEQMPQFPGGEEELMKFISDNLRYPAAAAELGIEGRVTLRFVVSKTGKVSDVEVIRGLDPSCDKEAIRVIKMMPDWIPGRQNGRNVPVYFTLSVLYKFQK